jgi:hypothetical protein
MTEQEKQLLKNMLLWDHAKAPECAMFMVNGIDLRLNRTLMQGYIKIPKSLLGLFICICQNENEGDITIPRLLTFSWSKLERLGDNMENRMLDFVFIYILYSLYPNTYENVETLEVFKADEAQGRMSEAISIFLEGISSGAWQLKEYPSELRGNRELVIAVMKQKGRALEYASEELKADKEVVLEAVKQDGCALDYASEELKADKEVVLEAIKQNFKP